MPAKFEMRPEQALAKYDSLYEELKVFFMSAKKFPGISELREGERTQEDDKSASRSTPELNVGANNLYLKFMVFEPDSPQYSPQITAFWSEVSEKTPELKDYNKLPLPSEHAKRDFFEAGRPYFRGEKPDSDAWQSTVATLAELEKSVSAYKIMFLRLSPVEAQSLGFSEEAIKLLEPKPQTS